jgi:predicted HD phosphohydrolase
MCAEAFTDVVRRSLAAMAGTSFTSMDTSTAEQWAVIGAETAKNQGRVAERVLAMLRSLSDIVDGFSTDQLTHCLQTATLAERAGADDEVVVAALCHDIGKAISVPNHPEIAAAILKPYVRPEVHTMIRIHQDFQGRHYYGHFGGDPDAREKHRSDLSDEEWALAERFADEWDQKAFDPGYDTLPLEHFEPKVRAVFAKARFATNPSAGRRYVSSEA